jgi:hypothetical protein
MKIVLTNPNSATLERAEREIYTVFDRNIPQAKKREAVQGKFSFTELKGWREQAKKILKRTDAISLDIDERKNQIGIGLENLSSRSEVESELLSMKIPLEAVNIFQRKRSKLDNHLLFPMLRGNTRPLRAGLEIGRPIGGNMFKACSLGFLADSVGGLGLVTNSHCTGTVGSTGVAFNQPATGSQVGVETIDPGLFTNAQDSNCPDGEACRWSDSAFITIDPNITGQIGLMAKSEHEFPYTQHYTIASGGGEPICGEIVHRVGRSTGEISGEVTETCCDYQVDWSSVANSPGVVTMLCQSMVDGEHEDGDSGAPVVRKLGYYDVHLLGIHWGGPDSDEFAFSPLDNIKWELGNLWVAPSNQNPTVTITQPADGTNLGWGSFFTIHAEATYFDFEDGTGCSSCKVHWISSEDGLLGISPVTNGSASVTANISGTGPRIIIAAAKDSDGGSSADWIEVTTSNSAPQVWIEWPLSGQTLLQRSTIRFSGKLV